MAKVYKDDKSWWQGVRSEFASFKGQPFKKKFEHFWTYYAMDLALLLGGAAIVIGLVLNAIFGNPEPVINGFFYSNMVDANADETMRLYLCDTLGINPKKAGIEFSASMIDPENQEQIVAMQQNLMARLMARTMDFLCASKDTFDGIADPKSEDDFLMEDLSSFLEPETYERLLSEGRIVSVKTEFAGEIPYLIDVDNSELSKMIGLTGKDNYLGVVVTHPHVEALKAMIDLIR